jgi:hypothetical protein
VSFSDQVLDWVLRHGKASGSPEEHDLVLVYDHPALAGPSPSAKLGGQTWRIRRVTGELTLRDALLEAGRLVAVVPQSFIVPMDLAGRAWLGRQLRVRPRDLVAALTGRPCEPIADEALARAVEAALPQLQAMQGGWSVGGTVNAREIRNVLLGLQVGTQHRFDREPPEALLARWLVEGSPEVTSAELLSEALRQEHGKVGDWLAWAVTEGSVDALVAAGALAGTAEGAAVAPELAARAGPSDRHRLRSIVEQAVHAAWKKNPTRVLRALDDAERRAAALDPGLAPSHPLLSGLLDRYLVEAARRAGAGTPESDTNIEALSTNLHLSTHVPSYELVRDLSRLARFVAAVDVPQSPTLAMWAEHARTDIAWGDLAFRRARGGLGDAGPRMVPAAKLVLQQYASRRDELNGAFGTWLVANWAAVAGATDVRQPFGLHHVSRLLLRPLLDNGQRVLLVVLDGCDVASFVDLVATADGDHQVAVGLPAVVGNPDLVHDLTAGSPWRVAVAPLPTVTSHARRALFAGDIPKSSALDATEETAANASHDKKAFKSNPALGKVPRTLLLKGDVGDLGEAVRTALAGSDRLVAVVLNDVDDALSSKETTPMRPWRLELLGMQAAGWLKEALDQGWCVVVTADHGHTPYVASDRKLSVGGAGGRIASEPAPGVVVATEGPLPVSPLHLLTGFGAWRGNQHRGWHGGASLEEVFVPLAFLTRGKVHHEAFAPPLWWTRLAEAPVEEAVVAPTIAVPDAVAEALRLFPQGLDLVRLVVGEQSAEVAEVSRRMRLPEPDIRQLVELVVGFLARSGSTASVQVQGTRLVWTSARVEVSWLDRIGDEVDRRVLAYLDRHGAVMERDLVELIGNPRGARRFAGRVDELGALAPFRIVVDTLPDGSKRYSTVKD